VHSHSLLLFSNLVFTLIIIKNNVQIPIQFSILKIDAGITLIFFKFIGNKQIISHG